MSTDDVRHHVYPYGSQKEVNPLMLLTLCVVTLLGGCSWRPSIPPERYEMAGKLIDEGTQYLRERKFKEANTAFSIASELAPVAAAVDGKGCAALLQGQYTEAERFFTQAYDMDNTYDQALANLALLHDLMGKKDQALGLYNKYISLFPDSAIARNNRAVLEYDRGERKILILEELNKAARLADLGVIRENVATLSEGMTR